MRIADIAGTELFVEGPRQIVRVTLEEGPPAQVVITGDAEGTATGAGTVEVAVITPKTPGDVAAITVTVGDDSRETTFVVAEPGWTVWMVSHFHYDPVWWNTQAAYTTTWNTAGDAAQASRSAFQHAGFELVQLHLETARREPGYKFVLAEVDYLKPFWDAHPEHRAYLRRLMDEGRVEIMGGTYNEPNTNLTGAESTIRNLVHGIGFQRDILGGDPRTAWQLDAFGHDPQFPGLAAAAGLTSSSWARGPFHQWGPMLGGGDPKRMQFPAEFDWVAPSGEGVLTHYMPGHYSAGWWMDSSTTVDEAAAEVYTWFLALKEVAATRNVLLPVGTDYTPPNKWIMDIQREWNARYVSPRFVCGLPKEFFAAVRAEEHAFLPQTRDMNPIYTGKDVSFIDTKQVQRRAEVLVADAEKFATLASVTKRADYPFALMDKAWRQLVYGAHHDAITGSESDQVYLDLLTGWREAYTIGSETLDGALRTLGAGLSGVVVWNPSSWPRTDVVRVRLSPPPGWRGIAEAALVENAVLDDDGFITEADVTFLAEDVPPLGHRTFSFTPGGAPGGNAGWLPAGGTTIAGSGHAITADPDRGGAVTSWRVDGRELLQPGQVGNELVVHDEYPAHPKFHEGPWHLVPKGTKEGSSAHPAEVVAERSALGERLVVRGAFGSVRYVQEITLWRGLKRVDLVTHLDFDGADQLVRLRWPVEIDQALPVSEVGNAVVGRGFAHIDADTAEHPWTLDNPAHNWFALSATCRIGGRPIGVAEIVAGPDVPAERLRALAVALVKQGVTATVSRADGPRYGNLAVDSNLPDVRIAVGETPWPKGWHPAVRPLVEVWVPSADLTAADALPVLSIGADDLDSLIDDLADAVVEIEGESYEPYTIGLINRGIPGFAVEPNGALNLSLLRSCTGWPSGIWIDPPRRTVPDGTNFQLQHWTHSFEYALLAGPGDWRATGLVRAGHEVNHPLIALDQGVTGESAAESLLDVPESLVLTALKPAGNLIATGRLPGEVTGMTMRLYEPHGRTEHIDLPGWRRTDLLETRDEPDAPVTGMDVVTYSQDVQGGGAAPGAEPFQPVFVRYWLHNTGPAPIGNMPLAVHLTPETVTVASSLVEETVTGEVTLDGTETRGFTLEPGAFTAWPNEGWTTAGLNFDGQTFEDRLGDATLAAVTETPHLTLRARERSEIVIRLTCDVPVQAQLISPWHTYEMLPLWNTGTGPGTTELRFPVIGGHRPGTWWALVKLGYGGKVHYTEPVTIEVLP
ncbi:glycoside hydrolase family 38 C-terminal domain-containing protein [Herbidospora mongoliensis]|uniref:glycoside hydrolase family 38 N-terminal domain-containing protein n=1 Tax=Herbidospora mongoliensis TaxID=688067 RepID=UPI00082DB9A6|nr:glycoside hydrolase family 38 C-terminal domain-containing protein [Herbidospora mongoliensis]